MTFPSASSSREKVGHRIEELGRGGGIQIYKHTVESI